MPRRARLTLPNVPLHIIQRGNNRQACFFADEDYQTYLDWLREYADQTACQIHAYVLMTNHVHLLLRFKGDLKGSDTINLFQLGRLVQNIPRDQKASEGGGKP